MTGHIVRRSRERGNAGADKAAGTSADTACETAREAAAEFLRPLASSSAATLMIFVPLAFLTSVTGAFFEALSITMAGGLLISFVVTAVGVPLLAGAWQQIAFRGLMQVFAGAAALVFLQLLFMYESFVFMATSLLAVSVVFIGLWLTGIEMNITAMMGVTMFIGIVTGSASSTSPSSARSRPRCASPSH